MSRPFLTRAAFEPMPYEVDFTGFLSNTSASRWMERLRVTMMRSHLPVVQMDAPANLSVIARAEVDYVAPIRFGDVVEGRAWLDGVTSCKWRVRFEFFNVTLDRVAIRACQSGAFLDPVHHRPVRLPQAVIDAVASEQKEVIES